MMQSKQVLTAHFLSYLKKDDDLVKLRII